MPFIAAAHRARWLAPLFAALTCLPACAQPGSVHVTTEPGPAEHTITVNGTAQLDVVPNEACIEMTLAARDPSMPAAHARLMEANQALLAELRGRAGLAVEQGAMRYEPRYESDAHGGTHLVGHTASVQ